MEMLTRSYNLSTSCCIGHLNNVFKEYATVVIKNVLMSSWRNVEKSKLRFVSSFQVNNELAPVFLKDFS